MHHILFFDVVSELSGLFGAETSVFELVNNLDKNKYHPIVILPVRSPLADKLRDIGVAVHFMELDFKVGLKDFIKYLKFTNELMTFIRKNNIEIIHLNRDLELANVFLAAKLSRAKLIVHIRGGTWRDIHQKFLLRLCDKIICVSEAMQQMVLKKRRSDIFAKVPPKKVTVIPSGRDLEKFRINSDGREFKKEFGIDSDTSLVGMVAAIDPRKGQDRFLLMAKEVLKQISDVKFVIVGDVYFNFESKFFYKQQVLQLCQELGLADKVIFTGYRNDIPQILAALDVFVLPSKNEALGGAAIEAMACGKPVVASAVDGLPEVIGNDDAGVLVNPSDHFELANAVITLVKDKELSRKMGLNARKRAKAFFDIKKKTKEIEYIYDEIIKSRN